MCTVIVRIQAQGLTPFNDSPVQIAFLRKGCGQINMRNFVARVQAKRLAILSDRPVQIALVRECLANTGV